MEQVCKVNDNDLKIIKYLYENREGLRVKTLIKLTNLKERVVYKRLNILKEKKLIENVFPIWKISNGGIPFCAKLLKNDKIFELHNISYIVKLLKVPEWWSKRKNYLVRIKEWQFKEVSFGKGSSNPYHQIINENFVIQAYPESLIIIAKKRYYSNNPYETIESAISDVLELLDWFCERFKFNFFQDGVPHIEIRNNDFNRMKDHIANKIKENDSSFLVELDKRRKVWVDRSEPFGKEANYPEAQEILEKVTKDYLLNKPMLNSELQESIKQLTNSQIQQQIQLGEYIKQNVEHLRLIQEYRKENRAWRKNESIKINKQIKEQKSILEWS